MSTIVLQSDASQSDAIGGKAKALGHAARAGLPVPPWFALSEDAFTIGLTPAERAALERGDVEPQQFDIAPQVRGELAAAVSLLCPNGERVAVRSSASDEDGAQHSFAGQLDSFLCVAPPDVEDRVRAVWRSGFSARSLAYRREHRLPPLPRPPGVIVQRMVNARVAGVAFSADPVSGRRGIAVVSALPGLGSALVSGEGDADTWLVDRRGEIVERRVVSKHRMHIASGEGVRTLEVGGDEADAPALSDDAVRAVAALAREAARHFARPQDIEWAFDGDRLLLLQTRPITSLAGLSDPDGALSIWDNSNIVESYSGVTTPLTFSFASEVYEHVYRQFCRMMRVPERAIARHDDTFRNMLGFVRGRLYYNLLNWYRVLALLPGYATNRPFMEQMMGVKEAPPADVVREIGRPSAGARLTDVAHLVWTVGGLMANLVTLDRRVRSFHVRLDEALAPPTPPLADQRPDELVAHYRDLRRRLLLHWDAPLVNDFFAMISYGVLRKLTQRWCGDPDGTLQNDLVGGTGGLVSAEPAIRIQRLAQLAAADVTLVDRLVSGSLDEIASAIDAAPAFRTEYLAYLKKFGDRSVNELKLETATLHDDPLPLARAVGHLARQLNRASADPEGGPVAAGGALLRIEAQRRVRVALAGRPIRRLLFGRILRLAQIRLRDRENLRLERTRLFGRVRRIFVELGRRFHDLDLIDDPRDVFFLEVDEVLALVDGRSTCTNVRALVSIRREEFRLYAEAPAPDDRFETRGVVYQKGRAARSAAAKEETGDERRGLGCSPGTVRGPVRVVSDPRFVHLDHRTILVAEHTDPGWIMIFPSALGVLVERGSLLSHAAIVARELGIPAIVSLPGVTRWLKDGDWVEIDGSTGRVRRIPPASDRPEGHVDA